MRQYNLHRPHPLLNQGNLNQVIQNLLRHSTDPGEREQAELFNEGKCVGYTGLLGYMLANGEGDRFFEDLAKLCEAREDVLDPEMLDKCNANVRKYYNLAESDPKNSEQHLRKLNKSQKAAHKWQKQANETREIIQNILLFYGKSELVAGQFDRGKQVSMLGQDDIVTDLKFTTSVDSNKLKEIIERIAIPGEIIDCDAFRHGILLNKNTDGNFVIYDSNIGELQFFSNSQDAANHLIRRFNNSIDSDRPISEMTMSFNCYHSTNNPLTSPNHHLPNLTELQSEFQDLNQLSNRDPHTNDTIFHELVRAQNLEQIKQVIQVFSSTNELSSSLTAQGLRNVTPIHYSKLS